MFLNILITVDCEKSGLINNLNGNYPYCIEGYLETGRYAIVNISKTVSITQPVNLIKIMDFDSANTFYRQLKACVLLLKDGIVVDSLAGPFSGGYNFLGNEANIKGYWYLQGRSHIIVQGGNYQMVVKIAGHPEMVASCVVPQRVDIQKIDTSVNKNLNGNSFIPPGDSIQGDTLYGVYSYNYILTFTDPSSIQNYYRLENYTIGKKSEYKIGSYFNTWLNTPFYMDVTNENLFENRYVNGGFVYFCPFFSDKLINGTQQTLNLNLMSISDSLVSINLVSISQGYYERLKSEDLYESNLDNAYSTPVQMYSNFTNAAGFLAGRTVSSDTIRIPYFIGVVHNPY